MTQLLDFFFYVIALLVMHGPTVHKFPLYISIKYFWLGLKPLLLDRIFPWLMVISVYMTLSVLILRLSWIP
jgi:hypothetical protein